MREVVERLAIAIEPSLLIGHEPLEERDCRNDREVDDIEPQQMHLRMEREIRARQSGAKDGRPQQG